MFPLSSRVEIKAVPALHLIVANVEIGEYLEDFNETKLKLVRKTKALFIDQHNRRFAWGLAAACHTIHAYVFGPDDIWYVVNGGIGDPYLEINIHEMDESTGHMEKHTYYSKRCIRAADRLFGCHARYFAVSTSPEMLNTPEFLVKDMWATSNSGSTSDMRESLFLNKLHAEFDSSSEFSGKFSQLVSTGPVYINRGDSFVADSTATTFAGLWSISQGVAVDSDDVQSSSSICVRQHRRTVSRWAGTLISAADNPGQIVVAIADAMAALNEVYGKCKIFHGNISD
ncbi:hypothetical protein GGI19_006581 [Coemansia pectinata]|uniref:Fungal-type protein kinase domain-containing protein n=1 Tax=Coemansia pectinata TaxID=1052879 RepID=A0A9W8GRH0_9FUNG|nr:hypothetical protein GGI19_006581 [Coemansia pectinata]